MSDVCFFELTERHTELIKSIHERMRMNYWNDEQSLVLRLIRLGCTLVQAIYLDDANVTRLMLENGYDPDEREPDSERTALHEAVKRGCYENVKVLIEYGADIHIVYADLPPIYAYDDEFSNSSVDQQMKILKIFIEHGGLSSETEGYLTPAQSILQNGQLWAINLLMQYDFEWEPYYSLYLLVYNYDPDALEAVRGKNVDLNATNATQSPVLSYAAKFGRLTKVQFLLENGANLNIVDTNGHTPFTSAFTSQFQLEHAAWKHKHLPVVRLLLEYGADAQYSLPNGQTVFDIAIAHRHEIFLEPVIAHLAIKESLGQTVTDLIRSKINSRDTFRIKFERCKENLQGMKNILVYESVTLYKLLTESQYKITGYARSHELAQKFKENMKIASHFLDPNYTIVLRKRVGKAMNVAVLRKEAVITMNKIIGHRIRNYHEMLSKIAD